MKDTILEQEILLLKGLARNDRKASEEIYKQNYNLIQALVVNNNGTADDARDIFQESMVVLFEKARSGTFELNCQIKTYLYSVAKRLWLKKLQQQNRFTEEWNDSGMQVRVDDDIEVHEQKDQEFNLMHQSIQNLGEPCKSLLEAFYFKKKSMQEIAESFGYTNSENAKTQKYKCLMRLKKLFFSQYTKKEP
ncbi:RNA polymerase subunit sigma-70 [Niabella ginsenosidivorans]|uniref:RNA polymerase subunit sigma-70 n=1 Tax=Niabella ginsenosidivorans TaxID=1176587 RepID=A0A1A9I3H0_9BACT|nr:sigma-70 family RNA polymerase sigma factor [Niabella ginsenosidivorans]ANH81260.1 RNA polymerase subunit sigma-70 [Niabella ginsenosidivorans]